MRNHVCQYFITSCTRGLDCLSTGTMAASSNKLAGKWCVVTGGGKGIGQAIAETFAAEGASIALVARSKDKLEEVTLAGSA